MRNDSKRTGGLISRFLFAIVLCVMIAPVSLSAQTNLSAKNTVKGIVVDTAGEPLMGAGVVVKGTSYGCITDLDGNFVLTDVDYPVTLVVSFI